MLGGSLVQNVAPPEVEVRNERQLEQKRTREFRGDETSEMVNLHEKITMCLEVRSMKKMLVKSRCGGSRGEGKSTIIATE
jgi:hypothetical protein